VIHLRQICLVAERLAPTIETLEAVLGIERCYVDPGVGVFGLENTLMPIGTDFLEVVAPVKDDTAAGRYLQRRKGDGGYMVICQADSAATQDACRSRAAERDVRVAWEREHDGYHIMQLHPGDLRAAFLEIDTDEPHDVTGNRTCAPRARSAIAASNCRTRTPSASPRNGRGSSTRPWSATAAS
jgi:hypothetical protein